MANSFWRVRKGIALIPTDSGANPAVADPTDNVEGSLWVFGNSIKSYVNGAVRIIATLNQSQALTNKTIVVASNTITTAASGNLLSTELNAALAELQGDIDTVSGSISSHTGATTNVHGTGVGSAVVGTTDSQALTNKTIDATLNTISNIANTNIVSNAAIALTKLATVTADRVLISDVSGNISASSVSTTTLGYLDATSSIQTQLNGKQASGAYITASSSDVLTNKSIDADTNTLSNIANSQIKSAAAIALNKLAAVTASMALVSDASGFVSASTVSATTLGYLDATSSVQTQINGKISASSSDALTNKTIDASLNTISNIVNGNISVTAAIALGKLAALTASKALVSDASGVISASTVTSIELGRLSGIGSTADGINDSNVLTNKTLTSPAINGANITMSTASNTNKITVPTNTTTALNGLTRTAGNIYYSTSENKYYGDNGAALVDIGGSGSGITALTGEVTATGPGSVAATIANSAVTNAKMANMPALTFKGNSSVSTALAPQDLTTQQLRDYSGNSYSQYYRNYITNPNAEVDTTGWETYADAAGTAPVNGTGGSPTITWTRNPNNALIANKFTTGGSAYDFLLTKDAANRQGEGSSYLFQLCDADKVGQSFGITFNTKVYSGTYTNGDLKIFAYDGVNILNGGNPIIDVNASSTIATQHSTSVFVPTTSNIIRLIIHESTTNATAYAIQFSDLQFTNNPYNSVITTVDQYSRYDTYAGYGSTNTCIPYFTNARTNTGTGSLYTVSNSATTGFSITALQRCRVTFNFIVAADTTGGNNYKYRGISLNSTELTTNIASINAANILALSLGHNNTASAQGWDESTSTVIIMNPGDVIRPHGDATAMGGAYISVLATADSPNIVTPASAKTQVMTVTQAQNAMTDRAAGEVEYALGTATITNMYGGVSYAYNSTTPLIYAADDSGNTRTKFIATAPCNVNVTFSSTSLTSTANTTAIYKNGSVIVYGSYISSATYGSVATYNIDLATGDYLSAGATTSLVNDASNAKVSIMAVPVYATMLAAVPVQRTCYIKDVKAAGTNGGTFTAGAWRTRDLNVINETGSTTTGTCSFASLSANQFTLQPGTYRINTSAPALDVGNHKTQLQNITAGSMSLMGTSSYNNSSSVAITISNITGTIAISVPTTFEIQHYSEATSSAAYGFGIGYTIGTTPEVYTQVEITKVI